MERDEFSARVADTAELSNLKNIPRFLGFLSAAETAEAEKILKNRNERFVFFGGYDGAERLILACLPPWCSEPEFPVTAATFTYMPEYSLSHRDFLGAVTALGVKREAIGDILTEKGRAVVFLKTDIAPYVISQINKVGAVGVTVSEGYDPPLPQTDAAEERSGTVASMRIDCVLAEICRVSRSAAATLIDEGKVSVNSRLAEKHTAVLKGGDRITVRGKGRFDIVSCDTFSKKGRTVIVYTRYAR